MILAKNRIAGLMCTTAFILSSNAVVFANEGKFADDFSVNSIRYQTESFNDASGIYSIDYINGALRLSGTGTETLPGSAVLNLQESTDSFGTNVTLSSETVLPEADEYSAANVYVQGYMYNDTAETSNGDNHNEGDIFVSIIMSVDQFGNTQADYCLDRIDENGDWATPAEFFLAGCEILDGSSGLALDTEYRVDMSVDRTARQLTVSVGELSNTIDLGDSVLTPIRKNKRLQVWQDGAPGTAVALFHGVHTDGFSDNFAVSQPIFDRYSDSSIEAGSSIEIENGKLKISSTSPVDDNAHAELFLAENSSYLEATIRMDGEYTLGNNDGKLQSMLESYLYNDIQNNGVDGRLGDIRANLFILARPDGRRVVEYCLFRSEDANSDNRTGLLEDDEECRTFPLRWEFDTDYRVSIELDKTIPEVRYRIDNHVVNIPVRTAMFEPSEKRTLIGFDSRNLSSGTAYFDNLRTSPEALTITETDSAVSAPPAFPEPIDPETLEVDSTISHPFSFTNYQPTLDFIDDFSGITTDIGFHSDSDRGNSGVSWENGAVVFETNSQPDNDDGNWTEFYLNQPTDSLEAVVSLSSESRLPPSDRAEAYVQIRAVFYNDTQNYGFNDREGDMEAVVHIEYNGDGRRRVGVGLRRYDETNSTSDDFFNDLVAVEQGLESIVPNLDQQYRLRLKLDRENNQLQFGVDDATYEWPIPTGIFLPSQLRTLVSVNHRGSSGEAIGKIHSIKTDVVDENFIDGPPALAPYPPTWNARYPGRSVDVVDGRLRLEADGTTTSGRDPGINALNASDYVSAIIELSSESEIASDGRVHVELHGMLYNDLPDGQQPDSSEGRVFSSIRLTADGNGEPYVQYCAFRSNDDNFDDVVELIGGDIENCPRFDFTPALDTAYPAFIKLDREAATVTYNFNGETKIYNIATSISDARPFNGVKARTTDGSKVVAFADDLAFSENPIPLAVSTNTLVSDVSPLVSDNGPDNTNASSSGSSGGGAIGSGWLLFIAGLLMFRRRSFV